MDFLFLGTGTSTGVPMIGCECAVCRSGDRRDRRRRCGALLTASDGTALLIDTPPELREACLEFGVKRVDAIALTHAHMDHVAGFDDVRRFNTIKGLEAGSRSAVLPCWALDETIDQMHHIFPYISEQAGAMGLYRPRIEFRSAAKEFSVGSLSVRAVPAQHMFPCCGYLFEEPSGARLGYMSDTHDLGEDAIAAFQGVDVMVLGCLREREHPTHLSLAGALELIGRIRPRRAFFTHLCHDLSHEQWIERLRGTVCQPAFDGLELHIP